MSSRILGSAAALVIACVIVAGPGSSTASAADSDFRAGLASLRAGAQAQAHEHLAKYRDEAVNGDIRRSIDRVLPLLQRPLTNDLREYIASTIEDTVRRHLQASASSQPGYLSRIFPVFP